MANFWTWTLVYFIKFLFVAAFSAAGIAIGIGLRKKKNKKLDNNQEA